VMLDMPVELTEALTEASALGATSAV